MGYDERLWKINQDTWQVNSDYFDLSPRLCLQTEQR